MNLISVEINGFLRQQDHKLPLAKTPRLLMDWACIIVRDYKQVISFFKMVVEGKYSLGIDDARPVSGDVPKQTGSIRIFDIGTLQDYGK